MAVREEGFNPSAQGEGETKVLENVDDAADINVIEEALDIKEDD